MRKIYLFALCALVFLSCSNSRERLLTSATGSIYECLIVAPAGEAKEAACSTMGADMYGLPQMEPYFVVTSVTPAQFDDFFKSSRNILYLDINPNKYTQLKVLKSRNNWSKPQVLCRIQVPDEESFLTFWQTNGEAVREWFVREEISRQISFYRASTNKDARKALNKQGYDLLIPEDYMLIMDTCLTSNSANGLTSNSAAVSVVWCCNNKGPMRKDIVVYSYPYTAQEQFSNDSIIAMRNQVLGKIVTAQVPGSHMGTEFKHFPPVSRSVPALPQYNNNQSINNQSDNYFYAVETRGLWKILDGEAMGGPFVSLTRLDQVNGRVVTAEAFLYAAGQKKRNALRQIEAILYSLQMPNEH
jgi:hypothetical protein